jgi:hypothetical protein
LRLHLAKTRDVRVLPLLKVAFLGRPRVIALEITIIMETVASDTYLGMTGRMPC